MKSTPLVVPVPTEDYFLVDGKRSAPVSRCLGHPYNQAMSPFSKSFSCSSSLLACPGNDTGSRKRRALASDSDGPLALPSASDAFSIVTTHPDRSSQYTKKVTTTVTSNRTPLSNAPSLSANAMPAPTLFELSSFGNLAIQSVGSSFSSFVNGRRSIVPAGSPLPLGTPPPHSKPSAKQVPLTILSTEKPSVPLNQSHQAQPHSAFGSPMATKSFKSPRFFVPRCSKTSRRIDLLREKTAKTSRRIDLLREKASPLILPQLGTSMIFDKKSTSLNKNALNEDVCNRTSTSSKTTSNGGTSKCMHLFRPPSMDYVDNCSASDGSLTDNGDEYDWFFLCDPAIAAYTNDSNQTRPMARSTVLPRSPSSVFAQNGNGNPPAKLDRPSVSRPFPSVDDQPKGGVLQGIATSISCHNRLVGIGIIHENSMSRPRSAEADTPDSFGPKVQACPFVHRSQSEQSLDIGIENAPMYSDARDLITPPVMSLGSRSPPPLKQTKLTQLYSDARDLITPPVVSLGSRSPPPLKQTKRKQLYSDARDLITPPVVSLGSRSPPPLKQTKLTQLYSDARDLITPPVVSLGSRSPPPLKQTKLTQLYIDARDLITPPVASLGSRSPPPLKQTKLTQSESF